jgi:hypothetical protein
MEHCPMLFPFFGSLLENQEDPQSGAYDEYLNKANSLFKLTSLEECDFVILPADWLYYRQNKSAQHLALKLIEKSQEVGKRVVVFFMCDSDEDIPLENSIIFRTSLYKSKGKNNEFSVPVWHEDLISKYLKDNIPIRSKSSKPVVGFCGLAQLEKKLLDGLKDKLHWGLQIIGAKQIGALPGHKIRALLLSALLKSHKVETNFVIRDKFWGGSVSLSDGKFDMDIKRTIRQEYLQNMIDSDYVLCVRGDGNYSIRFYETLCCGRIPVFINTDCVLPYDFEIDWKDYCIWINQNELHLIDEKIAEFHEKISDKDFIDLQHECRKLWKNWLSPEGFFTNFYKHFSLKD